MERGRAKSRYYSAPGDPRAPCPQPRPSFSLSPASVVTRLCERLIFLIAEESYYLVIISTIVILFIRSGWFPASYTEQIIAVSTA